MKPFLYYPILILLVALLLSMAGCGTSSNNEVEQTQVSLPAQTETIPENPSPTAEEIIPTLETSAQTEAPVETAPPSGIEPSSGGDTLANCANPYNPVVQGATWTYTTNSDMVETFSYIDTISGLSEDGYTLTSQFPELTRVQKWACAVEGLVALQFGGGPEGSLSTEGSSAQFETLQVSGVTLPANISPGDTWSQSFEIQGKHTLPGDQTATSTGTVTYNFQAIEIESVSVPAGTFQAMKIQVDTNMAFTIALQGLEVPTTIAGTITQWYAPGVGWVKSVEKSSISGDSTTSTNELISYSIP